MNKYLKQLLDALAAKNAAIQAKMSKSLDAGETPDEATEAEIEQLEKEVAAIEKNVARVRAQIKATEAAAGSLTPVAGEDPDQAINTAKGDPTPEKKHVTVESNLPKGIGFAQMARAKALSAKMASTGTYVNAVDIAKSANMHPKVIAELQKAVSVMDTTNAGVLVPSSPLTSEFIELLRADTIIDQLAAKMRKGDFNTTIAGMATGATSNWVGEGELKPVTNATFNSVDLKRHKVAGIAVLTDELSRFNKFNGDQRILDDLVESNRMLLDLTFIDDKPQDSRRPAGSLNGATVLVASGTDATSIKADLAKLRNAFIAANLSLSDAVYIMSETRASEWAELETPLGAPVFPGMQAPKGQKTINGVQVIESESAGLIVELVKASEFYLADEGQVEIAYSAEATITMPDGKLVNLFQENKEAIRAERYITWAKRRPMAAAALKYSV